MSVRLGTLFVIFKILSYGLAEESPCTPGFKSNLLVFKVHKDHLHRGERLGRVVFNTCDGRTGIDFQSTDQEIDLNRDGTLMMRRSVTLHEGPKEFLVSACDSSGKKHTVSVRVECVHYHKDHDVNTLMNSTSVQVESPSDDLVLTFPKSTSCLKRAKRGWIVPPISVSENSKGPFPMRLVKIKSDYASEIRMAYKITGEGADLEPKGIFQIDRLSGWISVTQQLDRETKAFYKMVVHANGVDIDILEKPMVIIITVTDQNDNKPVFTQNPFNGNVPETAKNGEVFMTITATDADDKENTDYADISYAIISQDPPSPKPNMFAINPVSGGISVLEKGLDREQWFRYTLVITATDMNGEGGSTTATAVISVTDSNDNAPQFDRDWIIPPISVLENSKGPFPMRLVQLKSDHSPETQMAYMITGEGADQDPMGIFQINRLSGWISVTQPLDREKKKFIQTHSAC
nr:cadherin-1 isoform X2 [Danio rerio]|eukprot:XP_005166661.1 cadherin-1 isoform X2 [Danio rerio]